MKTVADLLNRWNGEIGHLEADLRGALANKNIADVIASARGKLAQAASHADAAMELDALKVPEPPADASGA